MEKLNLSKEVERRDVLQRRKNSEDRSGRLLPVPGNGEPVILLYRERKWRDNLWKICCRTEERRETP